MNTTKFIVSEQNNGYMYSDTLQAFLYVPDKFQKSIVHPNMMDEYYSKKYRFLRDKGAFSEPKTEFQTRYDAESVRMNMANLRQLLIEVTDSCNLMCKYCGYGDFYSNYDKRETRDQTFANVKVLVDYLAELWKSPFNTSFNNKITIGFYGGEPLMNMQLIKKTIDYVEQLHINNLYFGYNMTTNAMLLDRYMDYLAEKNFTLLISLDGNEYNSSYRVDKAKKGSFKRVTSNVHKLKDKYPDYFEKSVNFNAVLHDRNSVEECFTFIKQEFGKVPRVSELNTNGIASELVDEFMRMFNSKLESSTEAIKHAEIKEEFKMEDAASVQFHSMIMNYCGNRYDSYVDLFAATNRDRWIPTGTCRPFEKKLFLTVNGKILPCEKIGQEHVIARLVDGKLELDCEAVANYYSSLYEKVVKSCKHCYLKKACGQCMFLLKEKEGHLVCPGIQSREKLMQHFSDFVTYAEKHPQDYDDLMSNITII